MKFWNWLQLRLGITEVKLGVLANAQELQRLRKKVTRKPLRHDQIERQRSERKHPGRHH